MLRSTPLHPRTQPLCGSYRWKEWNGYASVCSYDGHSEQEYYGFRARAGAIDVSPLRKTEIRGPDGAKLLSRVVTRNIEPMRVGRVSYCAMPDPDGKILDDVTVFRIGPEHWRLSATERWLYWLQRHGRGLDVSIEDSTEAMAVVAVQGPRARKVLAPLTAFDLDKMRFFRVRNTEVAGVGVQLSRTGYTGDLGYEVWIPADRATDVWDAIFESGEPHGLVACGLDALDVVRIEAGYVLGGVDYICALRCQLESRKSSPDEAGLAWTVDLEGRDVRFVGQDAVERERREGSTWAFVGLDVHWGALEALYDEAGLPPHLAPVACRDPVPIYSADGREQVGQVTSTTWSPVLKRYLAMGQVHARWGAIGTPLRVEHTVDFERRQLPCTVAPRPFFDPPRKRFVPGAKP